jgi:hypothetical protein
MGLCYGNGRVARSDHGQRARIVVEIRELG